VSTNLISLLLGFGSTLLVVAACAVIYYIARYGYSSFHTDFFLMVGASLAAVAPKLVGSGDALSTLGLTSQFMLLGLLLGRLWARYEFTGKLFTPVPTPKHSS
jgi:hypothetical protein